MADIKLFIIIVLAILVADILRYIGQALIIAIWTKHNGIRIED